MLHFSSALFMAPLNHSHFCLYSHQKDVNIVVLGNLLKSQNRCVLYTKYLGLHVVCFGKYCFNDRPEKVSQQEV